MERVFYKSKWKPEQLNERSVRFVLTAPTHRVEGVGRFEVHVRGDLVAIDIYTLNHMFKNLYKIYDEAMADKIESTPKAETDFRLLA